MDLGFETIGNAILIAHDRGPLLATDTWIQGSAYFGSWTLSHAIPPEQRENVLAARYVWISHGHPDHLSLESLELQRDKEILLPDHVGGRVATELRRAGFRVRVLPDGAWTPLSDRVRICSIADVYQDAVLLVDLDGRLVVNANDCGDHGGGDFVRATTRRFARSYLMCLTGYGDADMLNFFGVDGRRIPPPALKREPFGSGISGLMRTYGVQAFVPFSSMHKYQRTDSAWANSCTTPTDVHHEGFDPTAGELLPAFAHVDLSKDAVTPIDPPATSDDLHAPEEFGDSWSEELSHEDRQKIAAYLAPHTHLERFLGWIDFRVGGRSNLFDVNRAHPRGITFEVPRHSLMTSIEWRTFDDLLIGNFARTILDGEWAKSGTAALYPDLGPFLAKYGDNGNARSAAELGQYFREYMRRGFFRPELDPEMARAIAPYLSA